MPIAPPTEGPSMIMRGHTFGPTSPSGKTGRGGTYSWAIVNELRAAKHKAFSHTQGESVLHILLQVEVIASNNL